MFYSILIADDEPTFRESMAESLREDGYDCQTASNSAEAIRAISARRFDLLIADIRMPGNAKLEFVENVLKFAPDMPVILVTGYPSLSTAIDAANSSVAAYLTKPLAYGELRGHVERAIQGTKQGRNLAFIRDRLDWAVDQLEIASRLEQKSEKSLNDFERCRAVAHGLSECVVRLSEMWSENVPDAGARNSCVVAGCPAWERHRKILRKAVNILQETKKRFKSKELAEVRDMLEAILEHS